MNFHPHLFRAACQPNILPHKIGVTSNSNFHLFQVQHHMLKLVFGLMNEFDLILTNHLSQSITCLFFIDSARNILFQSNNFITLFNYLSQNIYHFEHHSSSTQKPIDFCNESLIRMMIKCNYLHLLRVLSKQINNSLMSCIMRKAILSCSILLKV